MFKKEFNSSYDGNPFVKVHGERVKENEFIFQVSSAYDVIEVLNFKYVNDHGLQPTGIFNSDSTWFKIIWGEMSFLIGEYKENPRIFQENASYP